MAARRPAAEDLKTLVIAEKPSVAADLVKVLPGKFTKEKTHYEGEKHIVSFAIGHLVTICEPGDMDDAYKGWKLDNLPILPEKFLLTEISDSKSQLSALGKLIRRTDIGTIVNACDAGREGELIFRYILDFVLKGKSTSKIIQRLWLQSMTKEAIQDAFLHLRSANELSPLSEAAVCRSEADWLVGINGSRGLTAWNSQKGGFQLTPCGRVQTPTLTLIVKRELERKAFIPQDYWQLQAQFHCAAGFYTGMWFDENHTDGKDSSTRLWDLKQAQELMKNAENKSAIVEESSKPQNQSCPALYDLTSLQREANSRFGFSAKNTLALAQALYEKHKVLTYPRTDSRFLPNDYVGHVRKVLENFSQDTFVGPHAQKVLKEGWLRPDKRIFNDAKVSDHHAIIPTGLYPKELSEPERKIFQLVLQRTIAIFFPVARTLVTTRISRVDTIAFRTEGKVLQDAGWKAVYGKEVDEDQDNTLCPVAPNENPKVQEIQLEALQTKPQPRYNESSLLSAMEHAGKLVDDEELAEALKERGLGTPATRAATIEKLLSDKYLQRDGRELFPTQKGIELIGTLEAMQIHDLCSPELTGEWEHRLTLIEKGQLDRPTFMEAIRGMTRRMIDQIKTFDPEISKKPASFGEIHGMSYFEYPGHFESADGKVRVRKVLGGRTMTPDEIGKLLREGQLGPLEGFVSKRGKPFAALLEFKENKVEFNFGDEADLEQYIQGEPVCHSFIDQSPVYETPTGFLTKSAIEGDPKGLKINRVMLGKDIGRENALRLMKGEKTELITGFRSSKTKRLFDAFLELDPKGKIKFSFPDTPRPRRGKAPASQADATES